MGSRGATGAQEVGGLRQQRASSLRKDTHAQKHRLEAAMRFAHSGAPRATPEPFDVDVQSARTALRNTYVALLFTCPFTRASQNVETMIWADTTYAEIAAFRACLARLEREVASAPTSRTQTDVLGEKTTHAKSERRGAKAREYHAVLQDLQRFLDSELRFWTALAASVVRMFALNDAAPILTALGIADVHDADACASICPPDDELAMSAAERIDAARQPANRTQLLDIVQKALTYCGDLERYRTLHSSVPRALQRVSASGGAPDFSRAAQLYQHAHLLLPDRGNPSNQLAVTAMYSDDLFGAVYQYYRALCVRHAFENARFNLDRLFVKTLGGWASSTVRDDILLAWRQGTLVGTALAVPPVSIGARDANAWLSLLVTLHALLARRTEYA